MRRVGNWVMASIIVLAGAVLSYPFYTDHTYFAESATMWVAYVVVGCVMGLGVAIMFINALSTLLYNEAECCKTVEERQQPILWEETD